MRLNRILMAVAMALMVGGTAGAATDRYREALKQVLFADSASMAIRKSQMKMFVAGALSRSRHGVSSEEALRLEKSLDRYIATQYGDDMVDMALPCFRENVSEQQLVGLAGLLARPDIRQANAHISSLYADIVKDIMPTMSSAFGALKDGRQPTLPSVAECTEAYKEKFEAYWQASGTEQLMTSAVDNVLAKVGVGVDEDKVKTVLGFVTGMTKALMLNRFVGSVSESELDCVILLMRSDSYRAQLNAAACMASDPMKLIKDMEKAFVDWAKANGESFDLH